MKSIYYASENHIFSTLSGLTGYYIADGHIFGPRGATWHYISDGRIFGPAGDTQCYFDDNARGPGTFIYTPTEAAPWAA